MAEGKQSQDFNKKSRIKNFIINNKFLTASICILIILVIVMIFVYTSLYGKKTPASADVSNPSSIDMSDAKKVEVLPQIQRQKDNKDSSAANPDNDPFAGPVILKGTIIGDNGNNQALIDSGGVSFIVKVNDKVGSTWKVKKIEREEVVLTSSTREMTLKLAEVKTTDTTAATTSK